MRLRLGGNHLRPYTIHYRLQAFGMQACDQLAWLDLITFLDQYLTDMLTAIEGQAHLANINIAIQY